MFFPHWGAGGPFLQILLRGIGGSLVVSKEEALPRRAHLLRKRNVNLVCGCVHTRARVCTRMRQLAEVSPGKKGWVVGDSGPEQGGLGWDLSRHLSFLSRLPDCSEAGHPPGDVSMSFHPPVTWYLPLQREEIKCLLGE